MEILLFLGGISQYAIAIVLAFATVYALFGKNVTINKDGRVVAAGFGLRIALAVWFALWSSIWFTTAAVVMAAL